MIVYGTKIDSDIAIPLQLESQNSFRNRIGLHAALPNMTASFTAHKIATFSLHGRNVTICSDRAFTQSVAGQPWTYTVENVVTFFWFGSENKIFYKLYKQGNPDLLGFWFIHLLLPFYFSLEGMYDFLHAGAVEVDGKAVLFIAPSMGGKSTMTDFFLQKGHKLISDDKVATYIENDSFMLTPSHPYHRPYRMMETLGDLSQNVSSDFSKIKTIFSLKSVDENAPVGVSKIEGYLKFDTVFPNYLFAFPYLKEQRLHYLSHMLNSVSVLEVSVPWSIVRLDDVYSAITKQG